MPWCVECGAEYRDGIERCTDCGRELVATLPSVESGAEPTWVEAGVFPSLEAAELAQGYLQAAGIEAELRDPDPGHHQVMPGSAAVALAVAPAQLEMARHLLEAAERGDVAMSESEAQETQDEE